MLPLVRAGVQPGVTHAVATLGRCMPKHPGDELRRLQAQRLARAVAMVVVVETHAAVIAVQLARTRQRPALGLAGQILRDAPAVRVRRVDLHVPVLPIQLGNEREPVRLGLARRQRKASLVEQIA